MRRAARASSNCDGSEVNVVHIVNVRVRVSHTLTLLSVWANLPKVVNTLGLLTCTYME